MLIEKNKRRGGKTKDKKPSSFRFDEETKRRLEVICIYANKKQTVVLEELIDHAYEEIQVKDPEELKKSDRRQKAINDQ